MNSEDQTCSRCGAPLPSRLLDGLCEVCLLRFSLGVGGPPPLADDAASASLFDLLEPSLPATARIFGDYELLEEIGAGGMGVVWRGRQRSLNRLVAVKMILAGQLARPDDIRRFRTEAEAVARLQHPGIVAIHEIGEVDGQHFFSMELVDGASLAQISLQAPLPPHRAATLVQGIAATIHHAHSRGVLHRDLKPSNILFDANDQPHVTDFGLAKVVGSASDVTRTNAVVGSPSYMAPEQASGHSRDVDERADLHALGAILYELLTGRPPFQADSAMATLRLIIEAEPVPPRQLNPQIPRDLETICLKCLEKEIGKRYTTAQDLADDLGRFLGDEPIHARPVTRVEYAWRWCRRKPALASFIAVSALLLLAILIGSPVAVYRIDRARKEARRNLYAAHMNLAQQAVQEGEFGRALQLLNGHRPAASRLRSSRHEEALISNYELDLRGWEWRYLWKQCQGEQRFILGQHAHGASAVGMLADGKTVFSAGSDKSVRLWDLESQRQIGLLPHQERVIGAAASHDGRWLVTASEKGTKGHPVLLWELASQKIAATLTANFAPQNSSIAFSPDSKWLAFATVFGGIRVWDVNAGSEVTNLPALHASHEPVGIAFSHDSRTLAYSENEKGAILLWDIATRSVTNQLIGHEAFVSALAFSPDGQMLASGSHDRTAKLWNLAERREKFSFTNQSGGFTSLAFSRDGRTLAMSGAGGAGRVIRLIESKTCQEKARLRGHLQDISSLAFTPNGQTLLSASLDGSIRVWDVAPSAKKAPAHVFAPNSISIDWITYGPAVCLSPDGRHLLTVYTNETFDIWDTLGLAEGQRQPLPFTNTTMAAVAPGGRRAAFGSQGGEVMLWDVDKGQGRLFVGAGTNQIHWLVFSRDGGYLAAADNLKPQMAPGNDPRKTVRLWVVGAQKEPRVLSTDGEFPKSLAFSADGKALMAGVWEGVKLWQLDRSGGKAATFRRISWPVEGGPALLPDGQTLISAGGTDLCFWNVRTRRVTSTLNPRAGLFCSLALSEDGRDLAIGASDGRITILDVASHQEVAVLEGHKYEVMKLAFTPDGNHLVSASKDQLRVWSAASWTDIEAEERQAKK